MWWKILIGLAIVWAIVVISFVVAAIVAAPGESFDE